MLISGSLRAKQVIIVKYAEREQWSIYWKLLVTLANGFSPQTAEIYVNNIPFTHKAK